MFYIFLGIACVIVAFIFILQSEHPAKEIGAFAFGLMCVSCFVAFFIHSSNFSKNAEVVQLQLENYKIEDDHLVVEINDEKVHYNLKRYKIETHYSEKEKVVMKYYDSSWETFFLYWSKDRIIVSFDIYTNTL